MLKGILEGSVLEIISRKETYGYEITRQLNTLGFSDVVEGTVYTILVRLEKNKLVNIEKKSSSLGPPRKFYTLTDEGYEELRRFWAKWEFVTSKIKKLRRSRQVNEFWNKYFNIKKMMEGKREYRLQMARVKSLPKTISMYIRKSRSKRGVL